MPAYLQELTLRLAGGIESVSESIRQSHADYLLRGQQLDGGFTGREGASDLYYTAFGLRGLSILGALYGEPAERSARFLQLQLARQQTVVDFFSLFYAAHLLRAASGADVFSDAHSGWQDRVAIFLESLRRPDGGYAKAHEGNAGSTYHTFLVLLVYELLGRAAPEQERIAEFINSQRTDEGGFREIRASKRGSTNPTAAAVAALKMLGRLDAIDAPAVVDFVCEMQTEGGGLRANSRIPLADLLSTFTGALTLADLNALDELDLNSLRGFVNSLQLSGGGFRAFELDPAHDVEYTFYGIGCLGLLHG